MAMDAFFEIAGGEYDIKGETQDTEFKLQHAMEIFKVTMDTKYPPDKKGVEGSEEQPSEMPQVEISDITFTKIIDNASPGLFQACCQHMLFKTARFTFRKAGGSGKPVKYMKLDLRDVTIQSVNWDIKGESGGFDEETIKIAFGRVWITYHQQSASGAKVPDNIKGWDLQKNSASG